VTLDFPFEFNAIKLLCIMCRVGAFIFSLTFIDSSDVPMRVKVSLVLGISLLLMPTLPPDWGAALVTHEVGVIALTMVLIMEVLLGLCLTLATQMFLVVLELAGQQFADGMGFTMAQTVDPSSDQSTPINTVLFSQCFVMLFFILNFHHDVIRLAALSFQSIGPGQFILEPAIGENLIYLGAEVFKLGFQLALPIFALMMLVNISLGFMAKLGEDFPVLMEAFAIRIGLGFLVMAAMAPIICYFCRLVADKMIDWFLFIIT